MSSIGLVGIILVCGQALVGTASGAFALWLQRRFFLHADEDQSFAVPGTVAFFTCLAYFWMVVITVGDSV